MSENKQLPLEQDFTPELPDAPYTHENTLGRGVVGGEMSALQHEMQRDLYQRQLETGQELEALPLPAGSRVARLAGRLVGKDTLTDEQHQWLQAHPTGDSAEKAETEAEMKAASETNMQAELERTRDILSKLTKKQRESVDRYLDRAASPFLDDLYSRKFYTPRAMVNLANKASQDQDPNQPREKKLDLSWTEWLAKHATDEQLTNFLQWHVHSVAEQNKNRNPEIAAAIERKREEYKKSVARGIEEGWLAPDAHRAIDKVDDIDVIIGDIFDTYISYRGGYHTPGDKYVVIAQGVGTTDKERTESAVYHINDIASHEWNHAVLGKLGATWINEAATEHIAASLDHGQPDVMDPLKRTEDSGSYADQRVLVDTLLKAGRQEIPVSALTRAYSADNHSEMGKAEQMTFFYLLSQAWQAESVLPYITTRLQNIADSLPKNITSVERANIAAKIVADDLRRQPDVVFQRKTELVSV